MSESDFEDALRNVINELKAPKSQYNSFGKYSYRNAEDILEAAKPLLFSNNLRLKTSDKVILVGERYYVESTVTVKGYGREDSATGYARESQSKKGMDDAQVTGSTSSYAKKYALNDLFDIDDTKDADSQDNTKSPAKKLADKPNGDIPSTPEQKQKIKTYLALQGVTTEEMPHILEKHYGVQLGTVISLTRADEIIKDLAKEDK